MEKRQRSPEDRKKYGALTEQQVERGAKVRGLLALVSTTSDGKKCMEFVNRDSNAAINTRRCAVLETRPPDFTRGNFVEQPLKVVLCEKKLEAVFGGRPRKTWRRLHVGWRRFVEGAFTAATVLPTAASYADLHPGCQPTTTHPTHGHEGERRLPGYIRTAKFLQRVVQRRQACIRRLSEHKQTTRPDSTSGEARLEPTPSVL